jgi:hypothetical protein
MDKVKLYFDEPTHKYTDEFGNPYISVTTLIGDYYESFKTQEVAAACARIGKNPMHPKYLKYANKSKQQILAEWEKTKVDACDKGNAQHNYFEESIKYSNGYTKLNSNLETNQIYTVQDVVDNPTYGRLNLEYFREKKIDTLYPKIYKLIEAIVNAGYYIYAEIGVFNLKYLISGLVDVFFYRPKDRRFIILDWKTNNAPIRYESGYYEKDSAGNITAKYIMTEKFMNYPLHRLPDSNGNKYNLQIQLYAWLLSQFDITGSKNVIAHIRHDLDDDGLNIVKFHTMKDYTSNVELMIEHYLIERSKTINYQFKAQM